MRNFMKKLFLLIFILSGVLFSHAVERVSFKKFNAGENTMQPVMFCEPEYKLALFSQSTGKINIYSADFELLKSIDVVGKPVYPLKEVPQPYYMYTGGKTFVNVYATQYLFNDDDLFEYVCLYENADDTSTVVIYNEKGENLGSSLYALSFFVVDDTPVFYTEWDGYNESNFYYVVDKENKAHSKVASIVMQSEELLVTPNPANSNETVSVTFKNGEMPNGSIIKVYSAGGVLLYSGAKVNGAEGFTFEADKLASGTNIIFIENQASGIIGIGKAIKK